MYVYIISIYYSEMLGLMLLYVCGARALPLHQLTSYANPYLVSNMFFSPDIRFEKR